MCFIADDHLPYCTRASCMAGTPTAVPYLVDRETNTWTIRLRSVPTRQKNATLGAARAAATRDRLPRPAPPPPTAPLVSIRLPVVRVPYEASDVLLVLVLSLHTRHVLRYPPQTT